MPFSKGTLIVANYTARVKDTGEGIESTVEDEAKKLKVYDEARKYEPRLVAVGEGWLISGLDAEVAKLSVGEKKEIELPPEKAFGVRDPTQLRMIPLRKFGEREHELSVGDSVEIDNRAGTVRFIGSGRAQVDFNHRLAGDGAKASLELADGALTVTIPEGLFLVEGLQIIKRGISNDVFKFVPSLTGVTFVERFGNPKAQKKEEPAVEKAPQAAEAPRARKKRGAPSKKA